MKVLEANQEVARRGWTRGRGGGGGVSRKVGIQGVLVLWCISLDSVHLGGMKRR